jgi:hypothetical protein
VRVLADTYPLAIVVEEGLEFDDVWMSDDAHNLQFTVLPRVSTYVVALGSHAQTNLEALVLEHSLDRSIFSARGELGLEDYTKGAVSDDLALRISKVLVLARLAVLDLFADDFCANVSEQNAESSSSNLPPILRDEKADGRFWLIVWGDATRGVSGRHCADCYRENGGL